MVKNIGLITLWLLFWRGLPYLRLWTGVSERTSRTKRIRDSIYRFCYHKVSLSRPLGKRSKGCLSMCSIDLKMYHHFKYYHYEILSYILALLYTFFGHFADVHVPQFNSAVHIQKYVCWLDIPVQYFHRMQHSQSLHNLYEYRPYFFFWYKFFIGLLFLYFLKKITIVRILHDYAE